MKFLPLPRILLLAAAFVLSLVDLRAEEKDRLTTLVAADNARIAAMIVGDQAVLSAVFSDELHYAHSNGSVDTKASFIDVLTTGKTRYLGYDHVERNFTFPSSHMALMTGKARIQAESSRGRMDAVLAYLAVWREENGRWRFLAWQSCRLPSVEPKP